MICGSRCLPSPQVAAAVVGQASGAACSVVASRDGVSDDSVMSNPALQIHRSVLPVGKDMAITDLNAIAYAGLHAPLWVTMRTLQLPS
jgi:hypothetical protein